MTKFKRVLFGVTGLFIFAAMPLAHAQGVAGGDERIHSGGRIQEIYKLLNLTDDQKKELDTNKKQHRARMEFFRQAIKTDKDALKEELMKSKLDMSKIHELHNQIKALLSQVEDAKLNSILAVRTILTPEQFSKFVDLMHKHKQEREE